MTAMPELRALADRGTAPAWPERLTGYDSLLRESGLRQRQKDLTRRLIADSAARLFAERGYEQVTVREVAAEAGVAEQTLFNHFSTKERLVTDREKHVEDRLCALIRNRPEGLGAALAIRDFVMTAVDGIPSIPFDQWRGEIAHLAAISPTVHRLTLELLDRQAVALADAIADTTALPREISELQGVALSSVFRTIFREAGRRTAAGQSQAEISQALHGIVDRQLTELERWTDARGGQTQPLTRPCRPARSRGEKP